MSTFPVLWGFLHISVNMADLRLWWDLLGVGGGGGVRLHYHSFKILNRREGLAREACRGFHIVRLLT